MSTFEYLTRAFLRVLARVGSSLVRGLNQIITDHPKGFAITVIILLLASAILYVPGFGDVAAQVVALILVLAVAKIIVSASKPKPQKKRK